ncbi:MAG: hypothetical protein COU71_01690 [Parcubacteria group bacterium CG10_big_fil_rev_8_21_14_0_10_38_31]|nr:MAG: hypothetical protein COU71_01690 [Parcubacteria group bacterium CG10_big_fil_rev_8_21_14_0_10_38_31]
MIKIIFSILFLGTAIVIFLGPAKHNWEDVKGLMLQKKDFNTALANSKELLATRDNLIKDYNEISDSDLIRLDRLVPSSVDKMKIVVEIESLIKKHGFSVKDIQVEVSSVNDKNNNKSEVKNDVFDAVYINISFSGAYRPLLSFISDIEKNLRIMEVENLSFVSEEGDWYNYSMKIKTYSKK